MNDRTVVVDSQQSALLIDLIERRLEAIGKVYYQDGQAYSHDLEISGLVRVAVQLGVGFNLANERDAFKITKYEIKSHDLM